MNFFKRLFHVGSLGESLLIYIPVTLLQRGLGLLRVLLLTWFLSSAEYGLWGLASMMFAILAPVMTLGMSNSLTRYVSFYEAHGKLKHFYWRVLLVMILSGVLVGILFLAFNKPLTWQIFASKAELTQVGFPVRRVICAWALINALLLSWYQGLLAFMRGMRSYRIVSVLELLFGLLFTVAAVVVLAIKASALAAVITHAAVLMFTIVSGMVMLHLNIIRFHEENTGASPESTEYAQPLDFGVFRRLLHFGLASLGAVVLWNVNSHISFYVISREVNESDAGIFFAYLRVAQTIFMVGNAAWAVLLVHVTQKWETSARKDAYYVLETSYRAICMVLMSLTVLIYVTSGLWTLLLKPEFRQGVAIVGPLLMSFQILVNMAIMTILSRLHERAYVPAIAAALGGLLNIILVYLWIDHGIQGAAYASAVGMFAGVGIVCVAYPLMTGTKLHLSTYAMLILPALLLIPKIWCAAGWAVILAVSIWGTLMFDVQQKKDLRYGILHMLSRGRAALRIAAGKRNHA